MCNLTNEMKTPVNEELLMNDRQYNEYMMSKLREMEEYHEWYVKQLQDNETGIPVDLFLHEDTEKTIESDNETWTDLEDLEYNINGYIKSIEVKVEREIDPYEQSHLIN